MDLPEIKALIDAMAASDLAEMEVATDGWTLRLVRRTAASAPPPVARGATDPAVVDERPDTTPSLPDNLTVRAPLAGTVYLSPSPDEAPFVAVGQTVKAGANLCVIEAMKTFNAVTPERRCPVVQASGSTVMLPQAPSCRRIATHSWAS